MQKRSKKSNEVVYKEGFDEKTLQNIQHWSLHALTYTDMDAMLRHEKRVVERMAEKDKMTAIAIRRGKALGKLKVVNLIWKSAEAGNFAAQKWIAENIFGIKTDSTVQISVTPDIVYRSTVKADGSLIQEVLEEVIDVEATEKE